MTHKKLHQRALWWLEMKELAHKRHMSYAMDATRNWITYDINRHYRAMASRMADVATYCQHRYNIVLQQIKEL